MPAYPTTKLDRAVDREIEKQNGAYLTALDKAGPDACPNCLNRGGGFCWCCTEKDGANARDPEAWKAAQR